MAPKFPTAVDTSTMDEEDIELFAEGRKLFNALKEKAQRRAIEDKMTQYYKKMIDEEDYSQFSPKATPVLKELHELKTQSEAYTDTKEGKNDYAFFTINLKPEVNKEENLEAFDDTMKDFTENCKYLKDNDYIYAIEQRSENECVDGLHAHILFKKNDIAPSKLQRAFKNKFFDKWCSAAALDYRYIKTEKLQQKIDYIKGIKEEPKMLKVKRDIEMKKRHDIPMYYEKGDLIGGGNSLRD